MKYVISLILLTNCCSCQTKTNFKKEHKVTDSLIYWNNQELTNESP